MNRWRARVIWCLVLTVLGMPCHLPGDQTRPDREDGSAAKTSVVDDLPLTLGHWQSPETVSVDNFRCPSSATRFGDSQGLLAGAFCLAALPHSSRLPHRATLVSMGARLDI